MEKTQPAKNLKAAKTIRTLTVAPLMALVLLCAVYFLRPRQFGSLPDFGVSILCLVLMPLLAYPLQPLVPHFKDKGREGQRNLAIIAAVVGYVTGILYAAFSHAGRTVWVIFLTYFISGLGIVLFNKVVPVRASGHACGVAGPAALAVYLLGSPALLVGAAVLALVLWASLRTKRHTLPQLFAGTLVPLASFGLALLFVTAIG